MRFAEICATQSVHPPEKTLICLSQRDALKWMNAKNVPGFTDEVIDTYARKVEGQETWTVRESKGQ